MALYSKKICQDQIEEKESQVKWEVLVSGIYNMSFSEASDRQ